MTRYITIAVLALGAGVALGLSDAQAALRKHALEPIPRRKGWYTTTSPVQFKAGEQIDTDGDLPKGLAEIVQDPQQAQREAKAKPKAKAEAEAPAAEESAKAEALADSQAQLDAQAATAAEKA